MSSDITENDHEGQPTGSSEATADAAEDHEVDGDEGEQVAGGASGIAIGYGTFS